MKNEYFDFSKFVDDIEKREAAAQDRARRQAEQEKVDRTRDLNRLYREHPLARTYAGDRNG
jgi:hypothetical protein